MRKLAEGDIFHERYRITSELGAGGMGVVYKATQTDADRQVAIKILSLDRINIEGERERFLREFQLLSKLSHEHIMAFYGLGITNEGLPYAVCEYIAGENLNKLLQKAERLPWRRTVHIASQIASALAFAHQEGIIHRDLKPGNVMLMNSPEEDFVKLIDFGLARIVEEASSQKLTFTGQLVGSVHYMSPEQCSGKNPDARSDIYALACLIFECLSGEKLFDADNPLGVIHQQVNSTSNDRLKVLNHIAPLELITLLSQMLAKSADERPETMQVIEEKLRALLHNDGVQTSSGLSFLKNDEARKKSFRAYALLLIPLMLIFFLIAKKSQLLNETDRIMKTEKSTMLIPRNVDSLKAMASRQDSSSKKREMFQQWLEKYAKGSTQEVLMDEAYVLEQLASIAEAEGDKGKAINYLNRCIGNIKKLNGSSSNVIGAKCRILSHLTDILVSEGRIEESKEYVEWARSLLFNADMDYVNLEQLHNCLKNLFKLGLYEESVKSAKIELYYLSAALNAYDFALLQTLLADNYVCLGNLEEAGKHYLLARESIGDSRQNPNTPWLEKAKTRQRIMPSAIKVYDHFLKKVNFGEAAIYLAQRIDQAKGKASNSALQTGLQIALEEEAAGKELNSMTWCYLGRAAESMNNFDVALKCAELCIAKAQKDNSTALTKYWFALDEIRYLLRLKRTKDALAKLETIDKAYQNSAGASKSQRLLQLSQLAIRALACDPAAFPELLRKAEICYNLLDKSEEAEKNDEANLAAIAEYAAAIQYKSKTEADRLFKLAKGIARSQEESSRQNTLLFQLAACLLEAKRPEEVIDLLSWNLNCRQTKEGINCRSDILGLLARYYARHQNYREASRYSKLAYELRMKSPDNWSWTPTRQLELNMLMANAASETQSSAYGPD
ncbi:MAG: serine/threonine protein kinase [Candidatus Obscuribacterales bacterium]|nr:serine/threonine protein kinase [Candidatus Obscuribacterales bacterium]